MTLEELRNHVANNITHCYLVKKSEIYKLEIGTIQGKKDVSSIYTSEPCSFTIGFKNPNNKGIWKPSYSIPFIDVMCMKKLDLLYPMFQNQIIFI